MNNTFKAKDADGGKRLDIFLCACLRVYSRKQIKELLDEGKVTVNGRRVMIAGWEIEPGDSVHIKLSFPGKGSGSKESVEKLIARAPLRRPDGLSLDAKPSSKRSSISASIERHEKKKSERKAVVALEPGLDAGLLKVYHHDKDLIIVEKPAGLLTMAESGQAKLDTLYARVKKYILRKHKTKSAYVVALHRLDAETSGIVAFALSKAGKLVENQFREHSIDREYTAVVSGRINAQDGKISKPLEKGNFGGGKKVKIAESAGEPAVTEFRVIERYKNATLLKVRLHTGRTHQIRVHLAAIGHPVYGDKVYSDDPTKKQFHRQALHASLLAIFHPTTGKRIKFQSAVPRDMARLIDELRGE